MTPLSTSAIGPRRVAVVLRSYVLSVRMDGLRVTLGRLWGRFFGVEDWFIFVKHHQPPTIPVKLPIEVNGITLRAMTESDVDEVARRLPFDLHRRPFERRRDWLIESLPGAVVAMRGDRIVGAAVYTNQVTADQPWYRVVQKEIVRPAKLTAGIFIVPGEKSATWVIAKHAACGWLPTNGVRTVVSLVQSQNRLALVIPRLVGARLVARMSVRRHWGRTTRITEPMHDEQFAPLA